MRGGQIMVEQPPGIFRQVSNDVDVIEERTAVCRPLGRPMPHSRGGGTVLGQGGRCPISKWDAASLSSVGLRRNGPVVGRTTMRIWPSYCALLLTIVERGKQSRGNGKSLQVKKKIMIYSMFILTPTPVRPVLYANWRC
jgi:hypothetical protein